MPLTTQQRNRIKRQYIRIVFQNATADLTTTDIEAAADAMEDFIVSNSAAINTALPEPFKSAASTPQKRLLVALVACEIAGLLDLGGN